VLDVFLSKLMTGQLHRICQWGRQGRRGVLIVHVKQLVMDIPYCQWQ